MTPNEIEQLRATIAALEAQRAVLGDAVVETALAPLREKLAAFTQAVPASRTPAEAVPSPDERKRITVLFADVSGYTAMSENLDPEDVADIMNRLFEGLTAEINRYGGTVDKFSGDAVMALFGAPRALENHEEMALRAALAMQDVIAAFSADLEREWGLKVRMRIGLNTGEVLAGLIGGGEAKSYTVMGDTVNLASRLEHACPVGGVMISADTARPLHPIFDFEPPQQITVKGKIEPITVYVAVGEKVERGRVRGLAGLHAPMVGRAAELSTLQTTFERALAGSNWQVAAVLGQAGIGKTRLRREFVAWITEAHPETRLLTARSYAHTQATPYYLLAGLMRTLFNIGEDAGAVTAVGRLTGGLRALDPALDETEFRYRLGSLGGVLGLAVPDNPLEGLEPEQRRDRTFLSLERVLSTASAAAPVLLVVEDLHWADALSLDFIQRLVSSPPLAGGRSPERGRGGAMLLIISRPPEDPHSPTAHLLAQVAEPPHCTLVLSPLGVAQVGALVTELLDHSVPSDLLALVVERAQGNPFFVEEVLRAFIEDGTLDRDPVAAGWHVTRAVADVQVPTTVQGVLSARLDRLPPDDKRVVQHASIIGRTFWQQLLAEIVSHERDWQSPEMVEAVLRQLQSRQLVTWLSQSQIADDWEWVFEHVLIQEVAYTGVLKAVRRRVHRLVAQWLEEHVGAGTGFLIPLIAYHYERGDVPEKAVEYLSLAGEQAAAQFANAEAVAYLSRALDLVPETDLVARYRLLREREGVYGLTGQREAQASDLIHMQLLADALDDARRRAQVALRFAAYYEAISDFKTARFAARAAVQRAEQAADPHQKIEGLIDWGIALWRQGLFEEARQRLGLALALARRYGNRPGEATILLNLGTVLGFLGDNPRAQDQLERALAIRRALGDSRGEAGVLRNLTPVYHALGDFARVKACSEQALAIYQTIGDRRGEAYAWGNLAQVHQLLGDLVTAGEYHQHSLDIWRAIGDRGGEALTLENLGLVLHDLGDNQTARRHSEQALAIERAIGDRQGEGYSLTYLALALEGLGEWAAAAAAYQEALGLRQEIGQAALAIDDLAGLARVALQREQVTQALAYVEEALDWIADRGVTGIEYPLRVYLTSADVLTAAGQQARAGEVLETAHALLLEQAARIGDKVTRRAFLEKVPLHRQLRERFSQRE